MIKDIGMYYVPATQSEVIKPLQRTVEKLGMTFLIMNQLRGVR